MHFYGIASFAAVAAGIASAAPISKGEPTTLTERASEGFCKDHCDSSKDSYDACVSWCEDNIEMVEKRTFLKEEKTPMKRNVVEKRASEAFCKDHCVASAGNIDDCISWCEANIVEVDKRHFLREEKTPAKRGVEKRASEAFCKDHCVASQDDIADCISWCEANIVEVDKRHFLREEKTMAKREDTPATLQFCKDHCVATEGSMDDCIAWCQSHTSEVNKRDDTPATEQFCKDHCVATEGSLDDCIAWCKDHTTEVDNKNNKRSTMSKRLVTSLFPSDFAKREETPATEQFCKDHCVATEGSMDDCIAWCESHTTEVNKRDDTPATEQFCKDHCVATEGSLDDCISWCMDHTSEVDNKNNKRSNNNKRLITALFPADFANVEKRATSQWCNDHCVASKDNIADCVAWCEANIVEVDKRHFLRE